MHGDSTNGAAGGAGDAVADVAATTYDESEFFSAHVQPLLELAVEKCESRGIPLVIISEPSSVNSYLQSRGLKGRGSEFMRIVSHTMIAPNRLVRAFNFMKDAIIQMKAIEAADLADFARGEKLKEGFKLQQAKPELIDPGAMGRVN